MKILNFKLLFTTVALLFLFNIQFFAQSGGGKSVRVKFKKGTTSATYTGVVSHSSDAYFLSARQGQVMTVKITGSGEPAFHIGTVPKGSNNDDKYVPITEADLKTYTYKIATDKDIAILVGSIRGSSSYKLSITIKSVSGKQSSTTSPKTETFGVYKTIKSDMDTIHFVRLDPKTKSAIVSGITLDWERDGIEYFTVDLKEGQRLIITPEPADISISTYTEFEPLDSTSSGVYDLEALMTTFYSISVSSAVPGKKYTLKLQLK